MTVVLETTRNVVVTHESEIPTVVVTSVGQQGPRGAQGNFLELTTLQARTLLGIYVLGPTDSDAGLPVGAIIIRRSV